MVRGALWLLQVVGEGNTFTKNDLRSAFPGVSQVDRRIRELRDYGWVVLTSMEDASLLREDQRFVKAGVPVWDSKARREAAPQKNISAKDRQAALARDAYMCTLCGIAGGESYPDDSLQTAVLAVTRRAIVGDDGTPHEMLVTECKRCMAGRADGTVHSTGVLAEARDLEPTDLRRLIRWAERGRRGATGLDRAWAAYLRLAPDMRQEVVAELRAMR